MEFPNESPSPQSAAAEQPSVPPTPPTPDADQLELTLPDDAVTPRDIGLWAGVLVLLTLAVYWPTTDGTLIWTDLLRQANPGNLQTIWLQRWIDIKHYPLSQYHPVAFTLEWFIYNVFGQDSHGTVLPFGYHVVSLLLHCCAAVLLWRALHHLRVAGAWVAAMLFAVLPINAESVAWISQLDVLLAGALGIGSVYCYLRFREEEDALPAARQPQRWGWYAGAIVLYVLAMLSKSTAWLMPVITLAALGWRRRGRARDAALLLPWCLFGVVLALLDAVYERQIFVNAGDASAWTVSQHLVVIGRTFWFYLGKIFVPYGLSPMYPRVPINPQEAGQWVPLAAMVGVFILAIALAAKVRGPLATLIGYLAALAPAMGAVYLINMRYSLYADHQAYLASAAVMAGTVGLVATALRGLRRSNPAAEESPMATLPAVVLSAVVIAIAGGVALAHSRVFATPTALWTDAVANDPGSAYAHDHLALADAAASEQATRDGDADTGTALMAAALHEAQTAAEKDPADGEAQATWGRILSGRREDAAAIQHLREAIRLDPKQMDARGELAAVYLRDHHLQASIAECDAALEVQPRFPIIHRLLAEAYEQLHQLPRAISEERQEIVIDPNDLRAHEELADLLSRTGDDKTAIDVMRGYVAQHQQQSQTNPSIWNVLGEVTAHSGDMPGAITYFKAALAIDPNDADAQRNLDLAQKTLDRQHQLAATRAATQAATAPTTAPMAAPAR